ncbi:MAG: GNAT family N-acetyltransferase [Caldilineaceae bacterium]|nr:GNAT family N-acetyltransferase [Caldilineaceae bacterium]
MTPIIHSERLDLILMTPNFFAACLRHDSAEAARILGVAPHPELFLREDLLSRRLAQCHEEPAYAAWTLRGIVLRETGEMVGHIGFHTEPNPDYLAELAPNALEFGYTIYTDFRRRGYAEEACRALMDWAAGQPGVERFVLSISPENEPSLKLATKLGFVRISEWMDEVDGVEWVFERVV